MFVPILKTLRDVRTTPAAVIEPKKISDTYWYLVKPAINECPNKMQMLFVSQIARVIQQA